MTKFTYDTPEEAWVGQPKLHVLHNVIALLDYQKIEWSPFKQDNLIHTVPTFTENVTPIDISFDKKTSYVYTNLGDTTARSSVNIWVNKGEIKWISATNNGDILLRVTAFVSLFCSKYSGYLKLHITGNIITNGSIVFDSSIKNQLSEDLIKKINKSISI